MISAKIVRSRVIRLAKASPISKAGRRPPIAMPRATCSDFNACSSDAAMRVRIAGGVAAGAAMPNQDIAPRSARPTSISVGTSGNSGWRWSPKLASARTRPSRTIGSAAGSQIIWMCPATRSFTDRPDPR